MEFASNVLNFISSGGHAAVIALLTVFCGALLWDRKNLITIIADTTQKVYDAKDKESATIKGIVDQYHQGNIDLIHAINEIKMVLVAIQNTRR